MNTSLEFRRCFLSRGGAAAKLKRSFDYVGDLLQFRCLPGKLISGVWVIDGSRLYDVHNGLKYNMKVSKTFDHVCISVEEASQRTGLSVRTIRDQLSSGRLAGEFTSGVWVVDGLRLPFTQGRCSPRVKTLHPRVVKTASVV